MLTASLLGLLLVRPGSLETPVTLGGPATDAVRWVEQIAAQSGVRLVATAPMSREILLIRADKVTVKDLMPRLALVTGGKWEPTTDGFRLEPDPIARNREAQQEQAARRASIEQSLKSFFENKLAPPPEPGQPPVNDPTREAVVAILRAIGPQGLAQLGQHDRIVFSTNPTRMQRPMPVNLGGLVQRMVDQHNLVAGHMKLEDFPEELRESMRGYVEKISSRVERVSKALFVVEPMSNVRYVGPAGFRVHLTLFDSEGQGTITQTQTVSARFDEMISRDRPASPAKPPTEPRTKIEFSEKTKKVQSLQSMFMNAGSLNPEGGDGEEVGELFSDPVKNDPLSFDVTDRFLAVAKLVGKPMIANLPDSLVTGFGMTSNETAEEAWEAIRNDDNLIVREADGWLTVIPARPTTERTARIDRKSLAALIQSTRQRGSLPIAAFAKFVLQNEVSESSQILAAPLLLNGGSMAVFRSLSSPAAIDFLRLLGTVMGPNDVLPGELRLPIAQTTPAQRSILNRLVYGSGSNFRAGDRAEVDGYSFAESVFEADFGRVTTVRDEPTEALPEGLPQGAVLNIRTEAGIYVAAADAKGPMARMLSGLGPDEMAFFQVMREVPDMQDAASGIPSFDRVRLGQRKSYRIGFFIGRDLSMGQVFHDDQPLGNAPPVPLSQLPAGFLARYNAALEKLRKSPVGIRRSSGGDAPPP